MSSNGSLAPDVPAVPSPRGGGHAALAGLCLAPLAAALALAALGRDPAALARAGGAPVTAVCFLAAGASVLRAGRPDRRPLARGLFAVSGFDGLHVLATVLDGPAARVLGPLPPGWVPLLTDAGALGGAGAFALLPLGFAGDAPRVRSAVTAAALVVYGSCLASPALGDRFPWLPQALALAVLARLVPRAVRARGAARHRLLALATACAAYWTIRSLPHVPPGAALFGGTAAALAAALVCAADPVRPDRILRPVVVALALGVGLSHAYDGLGALLTGRFGASRVTAAAVASGLVTLVAPPAVSRLLRAVDVLPFGRRARPYAALRALGDELARRRTPAGAARAACDAVVRGFRVPGAALAVRTPHGFRELARAGGAVGEPATTVDLRHHGECVGRLALGAPGLDEDDRAVLGLLAARLAPVVRDAGLHEGLRAGRERVVAEREDERRRLRRELHDGLGPVLATIRLNVETAGSLLTGVPDARVPRQMLDAARAGAGHGTREIRRLAAGLRPPDIDERGLPEALRLLAARFSAAAEVPDAVPDLSAACEAAVYRIAEEALTQAVRHAGASVVLLRLSAGDGELVAEVTDDGAGTAAVRRLRELAEEVGGSLSVEVDRGGGSVVRAVVPVRVGC
ncbi:sensor histidine kinase [Streptomyces caatingaensis]|uniref:sensor histidine kinase n=1 Tax=Streptomyces caatingaensis TaxID=1678637 RepID=UPI00067270EF|nr:histidine kinase [Streptomyces caatingaensis]